MKVRSVVVLSVVLALALPVAAQAALPKTSDALIVPAKSIGGVVLGGSPTSVTKAWGKNKACESQCIYEGRKGTGESAALGNVLLEPNSNGAHYKVWAVYIAVGEATVGTTLKPNFNTPLTQLKTAKGIGLGSTANELRRAYHQVKKESPTAYTLAGPGESSTDFSLSTSGRIETITIRSHPGG
jgi:hypothetical protein